MIVGIMSDSHGRVDAVRLALRQLDVLGAEQLIHCGDVGGIEVFEQFVGRAFHFVWGNTDVADRGCLAFLTAAGIAIPNGSPLELTLDGRRFVVLHGHEAASHEPFEAFSTDYFLHGHSHFARDARIGRTRVINPGALHRAARKTFAVLDTRTDQLRFFEISQSEVRPIDWPWPQVDPHR